MERSGWSGTLSFKARIVLTSGLISLLLLSIDYMTWLLSAEIGSAIDRTLPAALEADIRARIDVTSTAIVALCTLGALLVPLSGYGLLYRTLKRTVDTAIALACRVTDVT